VLQVNRAAMPSLYGQVARLYALSVMRALCGEHKPVRAQRCCVVAAAGSRRKK